jgi:two-component system, cell cycle sensor histidine kinase and response regulator CckA
MKEHALRVLMVGVDVGSLAAFRDLLRKALGVEAVKYQISPEPKEGIRKLSQDAYDLVVVDEASVRQSPQQWITECRTLDGEVPLLLLTNRADEAFTLRAMFAGANETIRKQDLCQSNLLHVVQYALFLRKHRTEYRQAEDQLRKLSRAVEQSADIVVITDTEGTIEYVNPAFYQLTGLSPDEVIGRKPNILKSGEHTAAFYRELWQTITAGKVFRGVLVNRKKNGELFYAEKTITPVRDAAGSITHFISNDRDISDRHKLEAQLRQSQKMDAIGQLAGGVAHDFNNLLMVISSYAELSLDHLGAEHPLRHHVSEILKASRSAADLTRQLLTFGRKQVQSLQSLDLNTVLAEIGRMLPRLIGEDIKLLLNLGQKVGRIKADPVQMEQVLLNLAVNARDAMPNGGELTIETSTIILEEAYVHTKPMVPIGGYTLLTVTDSGEGISPKDLPHIFEPFFTTKAHGKGTGLGLATVYGIVKQSGGFVWVYSEPGHGTTFKIYLPSLEAAPAAIMVPKAINNMELNGSETVLFVEDDAAVRNATTQYLRGKGYTVLEASDGQEAVQMASQTSGRIDLMVADVVMPNMSGCQAAEQILKFRPEMKILYVSGYADRTLERHGIRDHAPVFLQKPYTLNMLGWKVKNLLQFEAAPMHETTTPVSKADLTTL